jgi:hypothetical protein
VTKRLRLLCLGLLAFSLAIATGCGEEEKAPSEAAQTETTPAPAPAEPGRSEAPRSTEVFEAACMELQGANRDLCLETVDGTVVEETCVDRGRPQSECKALRARWLDCIDGAARQPDSAAQQREYGRCSAEIQESY